MRGINEDELAALFGGHTFAIDLTVYSVNSNYAYQSITPYDLMVKVGRNLVKQAEWEIESIARFR